MGPFHIPWSTFGAVLMLGAAILLAIIWALWDKSRDKSGTGGDN
jgi:hypothetical protein